MERARNGLPRRELLGLVGGALATGAVGSASAASSEPDVAYSIEWTGKEERPGEDAASVTVDGSTVVIEGQIQLPVPCFEPQMAVEVDGSHLDVSVEPVRRDVVCVQAVTTKSYRAVVSLESAPDSVRVAHGETTVTEWPGDGATILALEEWIGQQNEVDLAVDGTTVTVTGWITVPSGKCYEPTLETTRQRDRLSVTIGSRRVEGAVCLEAVHSIRYEATVELEDAPAAVTVTYDSRQGTLGRESVEATWRETTAPPSVADAAPTDPDDDGHYEDLTGEGELNFNDLVAYYQHRDDPAMTDHAARYDYTGDGELDFNDIVALYGEL